MSWEAALEIIVARTGHERFRVLCSDTWPDHAGYRQLMIRMSGGKPPDPAPLIPLAESLPLLRLVNLCSYRSRDAACGCTGHRCGLRSALVSHLDCLDCVRRYGNA